MRILALLALFGAVSLSFPCAAQTVEPPRTVSVPKQAMQAPEPQRLAPAQSTPSVAEPQRLAPVELRPTLSLPRPVQQVRAIPAEVQPNGSPAPQIETAAPQPLPAFSTPESLLEWVYNYRLHKAPSRVPAAVRSMRELGLFADEEKAAFCTGFIAGVLGDNPKDGARLVAKMLPMPDKDQAVLIRAIAFSGRPDWRELLTKFKDRMPLRQPLIDSYLSGAAKPLMQVELSDGTAVVYSLWGYYVATGQYQPVVRIIEALRWSKNKNDGGFSMRKIFAGWKSDPSAVEKIATGATAKWTLASYAERNRELLKLYRVEYERQPPEISKPLRDVIMAAELFEAEKVRKDQFGAIEDAQKLKATNEAGMSKAATAGSIAIATGCVAASALGQVYVAVPCVIGGALYTGAMKLMH
ncbi:MAG: hypothetical protein WBB50_05975 [Methyloceanibacter sp.]